MTTITTNQGHTIRIQHGESGVTLTATDAQAVTILQLTQDEALALCAALCDAVEPLTKGDAK